MATTRAVEVEAPASSANLGPGFDVLGLALTRPVDRLRVERDEDAKARLRFRLAGRLGTPSDPARNAASAVAQKIARDYDVRSGVSITLHKGVPVGVGLGSSAASSVCAAVGMKECFGLELSTSEIIEYSGKGEEVASGAMHNDNEPACLLAGVVVVRNTGGLDVTRISPPKNLHVCIVTPHLALPERKTEFARSLLPKTVALEDVFGNVSMATSLVLGFKSGDAGLIGKGMRDFIVEPARSGMILGHEKVRKRALESGAAGVCISGAGPTMLAVFDRRRASGTRILRAMISGFKDEGVKASGFVSQIGGGARVVRRS